MAEYNLGVLRFASKAACRAAIKKVIHTWPVGSELAGTAAEIAEALFEMYPYRNGMLAGRAIRCFKVAEDPVFRTRQFRVVRDDGTEAAFSVEQCLNPKSRRQNVLGAMRREIHSQTNAHWVAGGSPAGWQVDHANDGGFIGLAEWFVSRFGGWDDPVFDMKDDLNGVGSVLAVDWTAELWRDYHARHAVLELITAEEHKARTATRKSEK